MRSASRTRWVPRVRGAFAARSELPDIHGGAKNLHRADPVPDLTPGSRPGGPVIFSRQFRALLKLAGLWTIPWLAIGVAVAVYRWVAAGDFPPTDQSLAGWILTHLIGYGALGLIAGLYLGLLLARGEQRRRLEQVSTGRIALWGAVGGAAPPVLFGALGLIFGAPAVVYLPLVGLGLASAAISSSVAVSAFVAAKRRTLQEPPEAPTLRAP